ncbi:MAG TPA: succinate--CoA ligase subunit alpha [Candidatus Eisenbacteria bacterium]|jgi:succinyl-CoA synthetase alpha subunit|nr:succinate--CoA ligase subunit alpha [Candidatus Eisenbacteria bacterium]
MSVLIDKKTKLVVQGITGRDGSFHAKAMQDYGTRLVAGVTPARAGSEIFGVPVFGGVAEAVAKTGANTSVIYVPPPFAADAIYEAADAGISLIVCITEGIPVRDMIGVWSYLEDLSKRPEGGPRLLGPNCPGLITPGQSKVGILPGHICKPGRVGLVSRSGTLTYEVVDQLTRAGIGQSTCIGIGGDPVLGTNFIDALRLFEGDDATDAVVLMGEIGGSDEEAAARYIAAHMSKPVVAFIAGRTAPPGKRMGHAGAIVSGGTGTAAEKIAAFQAAGVPVADLPSQIPGLVRAALAKPHRKSTVRANGRRPSPPKMKAKARAKSKPKRAKATKTTKPARRTKTARPRKRK